MAGIVSEESVEGISSGQHYHSGEALAEWQSFEQVENGITSTSPPYWDNDDEEDCGIAIFSTARTLLWLSSNTPGWSHFAQFTIAIANEDPKKSKHSDTLHRFWSIKDHIEIEGTVDNESLQKEKISRLPSSPISPPRNLSSSIQLKKTYSNGSLLTDKDASILSNSASQVTSLSKFEIKKTSTARLTERSVPLSQTASTPLVPDLRSSAPVVSMVQMAPLLARSMSAASRLGPNPSPATNVPQSYRSAMTGSLLASTAASLTYSSSSSSGVNLSHGYSEPSSMLSSLMFLPQSSDRMESNAGQSGLPFGMIALDYMQNGPQWMEISRREAIRRRQYDQPSRTNDFPNHDLYRPLHSRSFGNMSTEFPACTSGRQNHGLLVDEFPYLDIINDLLDDEHGIGKTPMASSVFQPLDNRPQFLNRQDSSLLLETWVQMMIWDPQAVLAGLSNHEDTIMVMDFKEGIARLVGILIYQGTIFRIRVQYPMSMGREIGWSQTSGSRWLVLIYHIWV